MSTHNKQKAFTLIELLVVIAIIGILASVTLTNLSGARDIAKDESAKIGIKSILMEAPTYKLKEGDYNGFCNDVPNHTQMTEIRTKAQTDTGNATSCNDNASAWGIAVLLRSGRYYCADSTKVYGEFNNNLAGVACPAN